MLKRVFAFLLAKEIKRPVFILGCGRSGTTILGMALSKHSSITYLNERRDLWAEVYPATDIWTHQATSRNGKINLTSEDTNKAKSLMLRKLFYRETVKTSRPLLVEKLPINNFRVDFIYSIFPDARFIHIYRNGLEVARSVQKLSEMNQWFGTNEYKWEQLIKYARKAKATENLPELCGNNYYKGLLEWRLGTESVVNFLGALQDDKYMEISYAKFVDEPVGVIKKIFSYLQISNDPQVIDFVNKKVSRRTNDLGNSVLTEIESKLGGQLLPLSMDSAVSEITKTYIQAK